MFQPGPIRIIYSWSAVDPGRVPHYHGKEQRGVSEVQLLSKSAACPGAWTWAWVSAAAPPVLSIALGTSLLLH